MRWEVNWVLYLYNKLGPFYLTIAYISAFAIGPFASNRLQSRLILCYTIKLYSVQKRDTTASFYKIYYPMHHCSSPQNSFLTIQK